MNKKNPKGGCSENELHSYTLATDKNLQVILKSCVSDWQA